jgi:hypothetical protein
MLQVLSMFDCITSTTMLKAVRDACIPPAAPIPTDALDDEDMEVDGGVAPPEGREQALQQCDMIIRNLGEVLGRLGLKDQPDILKAVAETLAVILSSTTTPGGPPTGVPNQLHATLRNKIIMRTHVINMMGALCLCTQQRCTLQASAQRFGE